MFLFEILGVLTSVSRDVSRCDVSGPIFYGFGREGEEGNGAEMGGVVWV